MKDKKVLWALLISSMLGLARRGASCHSRLRCLALTCLAECRVPCLASPTATCSASQLQVAPPHLRLNFKFIFQSHRMAGTHREAPVLRQSPQSLGDVLYPPTEPHTTGMLEVSKLHTIYWEVSGNPTGTPVMVLHGGPGGGSQAEYRRYFDPAVYRVVQVAPNRLFFPPCSILIPQMDQRGCGKSTPHAELEDNNTQVKLLFRRGSYSMEALRLWWATSRSCGSTSASTPGLSSAAAGAAPSHSAMQSGVAIVDLICLQREYIWLVQPP